MGASSLHSLFLVTAAALPALGRGAARLLLWLLSVGARLVVRSARRRLPSGVCNRQALALAVGGKEISPCLPMGCYTAKLCRQLAVGSNGPRAQPGGGCRERSGKCPGVLRKPLDQRPGSAGLGVGWRARSGPVGRPHPDRSPLCVRRRYSRQHRHNRESLRRPLRASAGKSGGIRTSVAALP
jgi:hypothetical protein